MPNLPRRVLLLASAVLGSASVAEPAFEHGVSSFGEFKYPPGFAHYDYVNPNAPKGGTLVLATNVNWNSFTPYLHKGTVAPGIDHSFGSNPFLYDGLFTASDDEIGTFYGNLAEAVQVAEDFSRVRIRLRPEARWHDGQPVTARDVQFTFEHIRDNAGFNVQSAFGMVDAVEVHGERELTFHLLDINGLNAAVVFSLGKIGILPAHYWQARDITQTTTTPPLGSGPYRVASFAQSRSLVYERVPDYWGRELGMHIGRHNFNVIRYDYYRDATVAREAFRKGLVDYWRETDPRFWHRGFNGPALANGWIVKRKHNFQYYVGILQGLVINSRREQLNDARVREALTLAFHHDWYHRVITQGFYTRPESYFAPSMFAATGRPSPAEHALLAPFADQLPPRLFTDPVGTPRVDGTSLNRANLLRARELLRQAGYRIQDGVLVGEAGVPLTLTFVIRTAAERRIVTPYVDQLRVLGFQARVRLVETSQYISIMREFDFDITFGQLGVAQPAGVEIVSYWHSSNALLPQTRNLSGIQSEAADAMIARVLNAKSRAELLAAQRALDRILLWHFLMIPLIPVEGPSVLYWDKFGRPPADAEFRTSFPAAWWYDEEKAARLPAQK